MKTPIDCINTKSILGRNATPIEIIESARSVLGSIDLDPASDEVINNLVKATRIFTYEDDGFFQNWSSRTLWLNPPGKTYSTFLGKEIKASHWIRKLYREYSKGAVDSAIALVYRSGSLGSVGMDILSDNSVSLCVTSAGASSPVINGSGRISFETINSEGERTPETNNTQSSAFLLFSTETCIHHKFSKEFSKYGKVYGA